MKLISRFLLSLFLVLNLPAVQLSSSAFPLQFKQQSATAGALKKAATYYAAKKALKYGKRAFTRKVTQLAADPAKRQIVIAEIKNLAKNNPTLRRKSSKLLKKLDDELAALTKTNQTPYNPRSFGEKLAKSHGKDKVTSSTLPKPNQPNVKLAGKGKTVGEDVVPFDQRGLPIFDKFAKFDTRVPNFNSSATRPTHFRQATKNLRDAISRGEVDAKTFTQKQLNAIMKGNERIPGYTWHHHQDLSRMQLVPSQIHRGVGHVGGIGLN